MALAAHTPFTSRLRPPSASTADRDLARRRPASRLCNVLQGVDAVTTTGLLPPLEEEALSRLVQNLLGCLRVAELARVGQTSLFWAPFGATRQSQWNLCETPMARSTTMAESPLEFMGALQQPSWMSGSRSRARLEKPVASTTPRTDRITKQDAVVLSSAMPRALTFESVGEFVSDAIKGLPSKSDAIKGLPSKSDGIKGLPSKSDVVKADTIKMLPSKLEQYEGPKYDEKKILAAHLDRYVRAVSDDIQSPIIEFDSFDSVISEPVEHERPLGELVRIMTDRKVNLGSNGEEQLDGLCSELCSRLRSARERATGWKSIQTDEVEAIAEMLRSVIQSRFTPGVTTEGIVPLLQLLEAFCCLGGVARLLEKDKLQILLRELLFRIHDQSWLRDVPQKSALLRRFNVATLELLHAAGAEASVDVLIEMWLQDEDLSRGSTLAKCLEKVGAGLLKRKQNPRRQVEAIFAVIHKYSEQLAQKPGRCKLALIEVLREVAATAHRASPDGASAWLDRRMCGSGCFGLSAVESAIFRDMLVQQEQLVKQECGKENRRSDDQEVNIHEELICVVCLTAKRSVVFRPCNHLAMCSACSDASSAKSCPLCRTDITDRLNIYL